MARAGETPTAQFQRGDQLDYGAASAANSLMGLVPPPENPQDQFQPRNDQERFLTSPTDRPNEPLSAGAPFGPGAPGLRNMGESDAQVVARVTAQAAEDPAAPPVLRAFAKRVREGQ